MTNAECIRWLKLLDEELTFDALVDGKDEMDMHEMLWELCEKLEQEPKTDYKAFAEWVAREVFSDIWELNKNTFAEIACRKLAKLGMVEESGGNWVLKESEVTRCLN